MDTHPPKGLMPKPEISSVAVSGMVMTFHPSSCLNSADKRRLARGRPAGQHDPRDLFCQKDRSFSCQGTSDPMSWAKISRRMLSVIESELPYRFL